MIGLLKSLFGRAGTSVGPQEAMDRTHLGAVLIDVRETSEYACGHVPIALHLPLSRLRSEGIAALDTLRLPADVSEVLLICQRGMRSKIAQGLLSRDARRRYVNVSGGMSAWIAAGLPVTRKP